MSKRLALEERDLYPSAVRNVAVDCSGVLDPGETIVASSTAEDANGELQVDNVQPSSVELLIGNHKIAPGRALQFRVSRNAAPSGRHEIDIVLITSAGQRIPCAVVLNCT